MNNFALFIAFLSEIFSMHASYGPSCQDSGKIQTGSTDIQEYASYTRQGDRPGTGHRHSDTALRSERAAEKNEGVHKDFL